MTGFDDDDDGDSNGMAYIKVVKVSCYKKKCSALMAWPGISFDWTSSMFFLLQHLIFLADKVQNTENKNNHKKQTRKSVINERRKQT